MNLKQLQAEWRALKETNGPVSLPLAGILTCADTLSPHILQQERDRELINAFYECALLGRPPHEVTMALARARIKEMEQ